MNAKIGSPSLIIFDFDGVIADSEIVANAAGAAYFTELGAPTTMEQSLQTFMGKRAADVAKILEGRLGRPLPTDFEAEYRARTTAALAASLEPVRGALEFIQATRAVPQCIASSSSHARLAASLAKLGLLAHFADRVFSADDVAHGKPAPDVFLHAAHAMKIAPSAQCLVIEDSPAGIAGAKAAGMTAIGLTAGAHSREGHRQALRLAGADYVCAEFTCLKKLLHC